MANVKRLRAYGGEGISYNAYEPYRIMRRKLTRMKKMLAKDIMQIVTPYMWETGYCKNSWAFDEKPKVMLKGYFFKFSDKKKEDDKDHYTVGEISVIGFCEHGVCTDAYAGGLAYQDISSLNIETLFKLHVWVLNRKEFTKPIKTTP